MQIIGWEQNLGEGEIPPEWMWPYPEELTRWFEDVKARRKADSNNDDEFDDTGMIENELAPRRPRSH